MNVARGTEKARAIALALVGTLVLGAAALGACTEETAGTPPVSDSGGDSGESPNDGGPEGDAGDGAVDECIGKYTPPALDGGGPCGTGGFGAEAVAFARVAADGGDPYSGTDLPSGIYDAVKAERASGISGTWRETFVVSGHRFTRIRQVDDGSGAGPAAASYRSGTFAYDGQLIKLTYDCARTGDEAVDAGPDMLASDAVTPDCKAQYRYGVAGVRVTLRRR